MQLRGHNRSIMRGRKPRSTSICEPDSQQSARASNDANWMAFLDSEAPLLTDWRTPTERLEPGISHIDVSLRPFVAPHAAKINTRITRGIRNRTKPLVLKARKHRPCGFDSHRPLHSKAASDDEGQLAQAKTDQSLVKIFGFGIDFSRVS
jgi:hypothetical protein